MEILAVVELAVLLMVSLRHISVGHGSLPQSRAAKFIFSIFFKYNHVKTFTYM